MKTLDVIAAVLLVIGGLNWGLIGFFNFNFIGMVFGDMSALTRVIYCLVGISALYYIFQTQNMKKRSRKR